MKRKPFNIRIKRYNNDSSYSKKIRILGIALTLMLMWLLFWALVLKLCDHESLIFNYYNLRYMTIEERILWDLIPFNYRGEGVYQLKQMVSTALNCFVLAPFGVTLCYSFKSVNVFRGALISLLFITFIETTQLFTTFGNFATEDFITNVFGYFIGVALYHAFFKRIPPKATVIMLTTFTVIASVLTVYTLTTAINSAELIFSLINRTY